MQITNLILAITATLLTTTSALPTTTDTATNATLLTRGQDDTGSVLRTLCNPPGMRAPKSKSWHKSTNEIGEMSKQVKLLADANGQPGHPACNRLACNWNTAFWLCNDMPRDLMVDTDTVYYHFLTGKGSMLQVCQGTGDYDALSGAPVMLHASAQVWSTQGWNVLWAGTQPGVSC